MRLTRILVFVAALFALSAFSGVAFADDGEFNGAASIVTMACMVLQWIGSFGAAKNWGDTARKFIPLANFVVSCLSQIVVAFATGLGPAPAVVPAAVVQAGFFGSFGPKLLDVFVNALLQTFIVTGAHGSMKNTKEGIALANAAKAAAKG